MGKSIKREALTVSRLINEILVLQLNIPIKQIVNDTSFRKYTGAKRPDLLISEYEFDGTNEDQFIKNLVAYAEAKDNCQVNDKDWKDAIIQGKQKSLKLDLPYFIVTNGNVSYFYNSSNGKEITLNKNPLREFQTIDILRLIKNRLKKNPKLTDIHTNIDSVSTISETIFNKKLWELENIYRGINFKDNSQKIDFTIGLIALEYFEEKAIIDGTLDRNKIYWSNCLDDSLEKLVGNLSIYISRLENETDFKEFKKLTESVRILIAGEDGKIPLVSKKNVKEIYDVVNGMRPLHGCGFDLFGSVYEKFASNKEKKDFGEYFTRRHYTHVFSKILLKNEKYFDIEKKFTVLDLACGTGGFLTESFKVLADNYEKSGTYNEETKKFLEKECFYGIDVREENIYRTKLNMFLVGDGHTNMSSKNSLEYGFDGKYFDYIITNPPYGSGKIKAESNAINSTRMEIAFLSKIIKLLKKGGRACIIIPDGVLENPSYKLYRKEILQECNIDAVISLPIFAFAPYTKEKTYALFITKKSEKETKIQSNPIWMYIIDNDGLANSDKRFPTKLRNNRNGWMHDEISGWVSTEGEEKEGKLEERWLNFDDLNADGTKWIDETGETKKLKKGGFITIKNIENDGFYTLTPEKYIRKYEPKYLNVKDFSSELDKMRLKLINIANDK